MIKRIIGALIALITALLGTGTAPSQKCEAKFNGTFIQSWYCLWWDDVTWQEEISYMKEAGIEYLILQDVVSFTDKTTAEVHYPSELSVFENCEKYGDVIGDILRNCQGSGIKVFIGLADFTSWWIWGGITPEYKSVCSTMAQMEEEIYNKYYKTYSDTFYGWYFTPEINNIPTMKLSIGNIVKGLNVVIDKATELNPDLPMLMSPYYTEYISVPSVIATLPMWEIFMQNVHLRKGDIFSPQDAVGAGWVSIDHVEKVWQMYSAAVDSCPVDIKLWANCECLTVGRSSQLFMPPETLEEENATSTLDRFVSQMEIASKYAENIIVFSYNHYYSPVSGNGVFHDTYVDYLKNGNLDNVVPNEIKNPVNNNGTLTWEQADDNIGVAYYIIQENGKAVARVESSGELKYEGSAEKKYSITAVDGAGNKSAQTKI